MPPPIPRSAAVVRKATKRPFAEIVGSVEFPFAGTPAGVRDRSSIWPVARSRTNTSKALLPSPGTRLEAREENAT